MSGLCCGIWHVSQPQPRGKLVFPWDLSLEICLLHVLANSPMPGLPFPHAVLCGGNLWVATPSWKQPAFSPQFPRWLVLPPIGRANPTCQSRNHFLIRPRTFKVAVSSLSFPSLLTPPPALPVFSSSFSTPTPFLQPCCLLSENRNKAPSVDNHDFLMALRAAASLTFLGHVSPVCEQAGNRVLWSLLSEGRLKKNHASRSDSNLLLPQSTLHHEVETLEKEHND